MGSGSTWIKLIIKDGCEARVVNNAICYVTPPPVRTQPSAARRPSTINHLSQRSAGVLPGRELVSALLLGFPKI
jgi:hypothetical protein